MSQSRIKVVNPIVDLDGDEMTRIIWQKIKDRFIHPYIDIDLKYYDLGLPNRDKTEDQVTQEAAKAILKYSVGVKCPTISVDEARVREYGLKQRWFSPNGTLRNVIGGTLFREPIMIPCIPRLIPSWTQPIVVARHAFGDQYKCEEDDINEPGSLEMVFTPRNGGKSRRIKVFDFPPSGGVALTQYNTTESITDFAHACFRVALERNMPVLFPSKYTILTKYDGKFKKIFQEIYDSEYREQFEAKGIYYTHLIIDDLVCQLLKSPGGMLLAMKNYDGDVHSDQIAQGFGSIALMMSSLVSPDGSVFVSEAAHGTVSKHYRQHLAGEKTSTNPVACLFAWTRALAKRGVLDGTPELNRWADRLEAAIVQTVDQKKVMTKDLALASTAGAQGYVTTDEFLEAVEKKFSAQADNSANR